MPKLSWTGIQRGSLDHVLSNFADGDCKRGAEVFGVDHLRTICTLTGFDAGQRLRATMHLWDTSAMGPVDYRPWPSGRMTASRRGVRLGYIKTTSGSPIYDSTGMPSDVGIAYTYQACGKGSAQTQITSMPAGGTYSFGVLKFAEWLPICLAP